MFCSVYPVFKSIASNVTLHSPNSSWVWYHHIKAWGDWKDERTRVELKETLVQGLRHSQLCGYMVSSPPCSQVTVEEGNVQTLLPAACLLQLAEIQEACCEFLKRQLDPSNCLGIRAFADTHSCRELLRIADKFTQHNFQEVRNPIFYILQKQYRYT